MNITFLIGNGFDVNLGLKTKYTDFYDSYIESNANLPENDCIKEFCSLIKSDYKTWADFEVAFAQNVEGTPKQIRDILGDFTVKFACYLRQQLKNCNYDDNTICAKFKSFLTKSYDLLETKDKEIIQNKYKSHMDDNEDIKVNFINFNYTNTIEQLIANYRNYNNNSTVLRRYGTHNNFTESFGKILHIHGTLDDLIIIGIDSIQQITYEDLKRNTLVEKYCVKSKMNEEYGYSQIEAQYVQMINNSEIIYTYGISFGESDKSRWIVINEWLKKDAKNKLIIFKYDTKFNTHDKVYRNLLLDAINDAKDEYLKILGFSEDEYERYYEQIFVIDSADVLQFKVVPDTQNATESEVNVEVLV